MAQKPVLRGEVGSACVARAVSVEIGGMGDAGGQEMAFGRSLQRHLNHFDLPTEFTE